MRADEYRRLVATLASAVNERDVLRLAVQSTCVEVDLMEQLRNAQSRLDSVTKERDAVWVKFNEAVGERNTIAGRLDSVRRLLELDVDDDRRWDEMSKLFPGVKVEAAVVEHLCPKCGKHIGTNPLLDTHACG